MFHIFGSDGITVTENGRKTIFVPKDHESYEDIKNNITKMSYNDVFSLVDTKSHLQMLLSEEVEVYFNEDDDLQIDLQGLTDNHKKDLKTLAFSFISSIPDLDGDKKYQIQKLLEKLDVTKVHLVFE